MNFIKNLLIDGGPSSSRLINIGVFIGFTVMMLKLSWVVKDIFDLNIWFWAIATTYAVYGMGTATMNKWLDVLKAKAGAKDV